VCVCVTENVCACICVGGWVGERKCVRVGGWVGERESVCGVRQRGCACVCERECVKPFYVSSKSMQGRPRTRLIHAAL